MIETKLGLVSWRRPTDVLASPGGIIFLSAVAAILVFSDSPTTRGLGLAVVLLIGAAAYRTPWIGMLAVFPMAFAIRPAPPAIGFQEAVFAVLTTYVSMRVIIEAGQRLGWIRLFRQYGASVGLGGAFLAVNYLVAHSNGVTNGDWLRGVAPFVFISLAIPISLGVSQDRQRVHWLVISVLTLAVLMSGYVAGYYLVEKMWQPYWVMELNGVMTRVTEVEALASPSMVSGPLIERVTMRIPVATDALLPFGLATGVIIAVLRKDVSVRVPALLIAGLALTAILMTYTRSTLLSPLLVLILFFGYLAKWRRESLKDACLIMLGLGGLALAVIFVFDMESIWLMRLALLQSALGRHAGETVVDVNITTRMEEYRIAWQMFVDHPVAGNGLGAKHDMTFVTLEGQALHQVVSYIHNWVLYVLMAGGVIGFAVYGYLLHGPILRLKSAQISSDLLTLAIMGGLLTLSIYGLFFAVSRLITFNILLAAAWGIALAQKYADSQTR